MNYIIIKKKIPYVYLCYNLKGYHPNKTPNLTLFLLIIINTIIKSSFSKTLLSI